MAKGFVYLTTVVDWASSKVFAAKMAITLEACHAVDVLGQAFKQYGKPEIVNTDQDTQFTAKAFVDPVQNQGCQLGMDGRGAWRDNVFGDRRRRAVKMSRFIHRLTIPSAKRLIRFDIISNYVQP